MKLLTLARASALALAGIGLFAGHASAAPIPITVINSGFEIAAPIPQDNCPITGWTCSQDDGTMGIYTPSVFVTPYTGAVPEGANVAFIGPNASSGTLSQITGDLITANTAYSLSVFIGHRNDFPFATGTSTLNLIAGGTTIFATVNITDPGQNTWLDQTLNVADANAFVGQTLGIVLKAPAGTTVGQINFDNVRLTADSAALITPVPEPATLTLLGLGLVGVGARVRRKLRRPA